MSEVKRTKQRIMLKMWKMPKGNDADDHRATGTAAAPTGRFRYNLNII